MLFHTRSFLLITSFAGLAAVSTAQVKLNGFGGYTFQDKFDMSGTYNGYSYSNAVVSDGTHFGGGIEFAMRPTKSIELFYQTQKVDAFMHTSLSDIGPYDLNISYIMIGGLGYAPFSPAVSGYGGINLGAGFVGGDATATKFAIGGKLGLMLNMSPTVGIKLGGQLLSMVQGAGGGFYFGTGGASAGVSTYSSIYQFGFTGGLCISLNGGNNGSAAKPPAPYPTSTPPPPPPPTN